MQFRNATHEDIEMILTIENQGFNQNEAGTRDQYLDRIANFPETFIVAEDEQAGVLGFICGPAVNQRFVDDWMYEENPKNIAQGGYQTVLTVAVHQAARGLGLGSQLLSQLTTRAQAAGREAIALTCLADRIPFYEKTTLRISAHHNLLMPVSNGTIWKRYCIMPEFLTSGLEPDVFAMWREYCLG